MVKRKAIAVVIYLLLLLAVPALAQGPGAFTTLTTTSTSTTSVRVGCAAGSTVCTGGIKSGPIDVSSVTSSGFIEIANNVPATTTFRLYNNAGTLTWNGSALAIGSSVSGTLGKIPKFTGAATLGDSLLSESGTTVTMAGTLAATTFSGSGASLTALPAAQLSGTITSATQDLITRLGTITSGVWNGTLIGLQYGGTGSNLSGTGGTSQFLRQNTVGGVVTVVRPAVSDLSDASNVGLLNAANTWSLLNTFSNGVTTNTATLTGSTYLVASATSAGAEIGSLSVVGTPFLDFHSSGNNIDYDSRIIATGGTGVLGNGILTLSAAGGINLGGNTSLTTGYWREGSTTNVSVTAVGSTIDPLGASLVYITAVTNPATNTVTTINGGVDGRVVKICAATGTGGFQGYGTAGNITVGTTVVSGGQCATFVYRSSDGKWYLLSF